MAGAVSKDMLGVVVASGGAVLVPQKMYTVVEVHVTVSRVDVLAPKNGKDVVKCRTPGLLRFFRDSLEPQHCRSRCLFAKFCTTRDTSAGFRDRCDWLDTPQFVVVLWCLKLR